MALKSLRTLNSKSKAASKPKAAAAVVEDDDLIEDVILDEEDTEEEEAAVQPAKKMTKLKAKVKPKVIEEDDEEEDDIEEEELEDEDDIEEDEEELEDEDDIEEEPVKVAPKAKLKSKAKAKAVVAEDDDDAEEDDIEEEVPVKAKAKTKVKAKPAATGSLFSKKSATTATPLVEGATMKRETLIDLMVNRFTTEMGVTPSKKEVSQIISMLEDVLLEEVFPLYSVNFCGAKFKRTIVAPRVYSGAGGLDVAVKTDTQVSEHIKVTGSIFIGKESIKGKVDKKGNFKPL